ncbi:hypothetical protein PAXINDRAFT_177545 [Paxillus involutus ATCC 200175]|uniref:Uncharacterized protein n=1 Tax=Paxillus involutus ATCC 200175 TaxID=664439 RepID=A0A0C9T0L7_PAXIN|nr:hypothetical protein PAXINDRAFT_177545 [Paxillus involutus ATCC 200175]
MSQWAPICLGIMGSPDVANGLQINGMGGGISSLSKICVVGAPTRRRIYLNCGNLFNVVGAFALQEGICSRDSALVETTTRVFNTNAKSQIHTVFPTAVAGVSGKASRIILEFPKPTGALTGKLLPGGNLVDIINVHARPGTRVPVSLVDATNPTVLITLPNLTRILNVPTQPNVDFPKETVLELVEPIRTQIAVKMGLDPSAHAQPKVAVISPPAAQDHDIYIQAYSMGVPHKAVPMTVGLCLGVAANMEGSLVQKTARGLESGASSRGLLTIKHSSGFVKVDAEFEADGSVKSARTVRTRRWLMRGVVYW